MANISDDIRIYVKELIAEQLGSLDNKDRGIPKSEEAEDGNVIQNRWANQSDDSHLIQDIGDE